MQNQEKRSMLEAQVQSLKDIIKTFEASNPDEVAKKWRAKVFEELMRNKQLQIGHATELRKGQEEVRRLQAKVDDMILSLQKSQSNLSLVMQENEALQQSLITERQERSVLINIQKQQQTLLLASPQHLQGQFQVMGAILGRLEKYEQKIGICLGQIRAARIVVGKERISQGKRLRELKTDMEKLKSQAYQAMSLIPETEAAKRRISELQSLVQQLTREKSDFDSEMRLKFEKFTTESEKEKEALLISLKRAENDLMEARRAIESYKNELTELKEDVSHLAELKTSKTKEIEVLETNISALESALQIAKSEAQIAIKTVISDLTQKHESAIASFQSEMADLRSEIEGKTSENEGFRLEFSAEKSDLLREIGLLEKTIKEMKRDRGLLLSSLKSQEKRQASTAVKEVQTVPEASKPAVRPVAAGPQSSSRYEDVLALGEDLLDMH